MTDNRQLSIWQLRFINQHDWDAVANRIAAFTLADADEFLLCLNMFYLTFTCRGMLKCQVTFSRVYVDFQPSKGFSII